MRPMRTLTRRALLAGSAAIVGGVAFGTYKIATPHKNPLLNDLAPNETSFNPHIKITNDAITLVVNHADKGQGVQSAQAVLIAEELDVDLDQVTLTFGRPDPAYYNTAMASEAVPFMSFDQGFVAETLRAAAGGAIKLMGLQLTGGSTSIPDQFDKLRFAGAVARETLKQAACSLHNVPIAQLRTEKGAVILPDGTRLAYTALAQHAAGIAPVTDVVLRDPHEWRLIGQTQPRTDMPAKITGQQKFGIDLTLPGMVHATVRTNPRKGAGMRRVDATKARAMRGVQDVFEITNGVAVIADNTWRAFQAANAIAVDWAPATYPAEQDDHWAEVAASFTPDRLDRAWRSDGAPEDHLAETPETAPDGILTAEYRAPYVAHAPLEPLSALVLIKDGEVDVWTGHQAPGFLIEKVSEQTGVPVGNVRFHNQFMGGSFGHRLELAFVLQAVEVAQRVPGTPVKMTYSREEDFAQDFPREIGMARAQGRVGGGQVQALGLDIASPSPVSSQMGRLGMPVPGPDMQIVAGAWNMPYVVPHLRVRGYRVPELAPVSSWRSVGASIAGLFGESFLDELIHAAGADPMAERLRLVNHPVHRAVLEAVAEMSNWGSALPANAGRGVALVESFGVPTATVVEVHATDAGIKIMQAWVAADVGRVVDPGNLESQLSGGAIWGLGHAMNAEITYADGMAEQENYYDHAGMRLHQCPKVTVRALENAKTLRGAGEPAVPPAAPALANAIFAATGQRLRQMPFNNDIDFV